MDVPWTPFTSTRAQGVSVVDVRWTPSTSTRAQGVSVVDVPWTPSTSTASASVTLRRRPSVTTCRRRISSRAGSSITTASTRRRGTFCVTGTAPTRTRARPPSAVWLVSADSLPPRLFAFLKAMDNMVNVPNMVRHGHNYAVEDWSAFVVNHTIVTDPTIRQPGFDLSLVIGPTSFPMNRFRTGQRPCRVNLHEWGLAQSPFCDCGQLYTHNEPRCRHVPINKIRRRTESTPQSG